MIERCIDALGKYSFSTGPMKEKVRDKIEAIRASGSITIVLRFLIPHVDTDYLLKARTESVLKSHEFKEVTLILESRIKSAIYSKVESYNKYFEKFKPYKRNLILNASTKTYHVRQQDELVKRSVVEVKFRVHDSSRLNSNDFTTLILLFIEGPIHFSEKIVAIIRDKEDADNNFVYHAFKKELHSETSSILTLRDKERIFEYYNDELVQNIIVEFLNPSKKRACKVTLDKLRKELPVRKSLRVETKKNSYEKISELLEINISREELSRYIKDNYIAGFYAGTLDLDDNLKFLIVDIDVSRFFRALFSQQVVWELLLQVTSSLIEVGRTMGIQGYPLVKFSGSRGMHIVYKYQDDDENRISDELKRINLSTYFYSFPGFHELVRIGNSPLKEIPFLFHTIQNIQEKSYPQESRLLWLQYQIIHKCLLWKH